MISSSQTQALSLWQKRKQGLDWRQLRVLVKLHLLTHFRPTISASDGKATGMWTKTILSNVFLGYLFTFNSNLLADLESYVILLYFVTFSMIALSSFPDAMDIRQRNIELLHCKPISHRTLFASEIIVLAVQVTLLVSCFATPALVACRNIYDISIPMIFALIVMLIIGTTAISMIMQMLILIASQWISLAKLKNGCQILAILILIPSSSMNALLQHSLNLGRKSISLSDLFWVKLFPSSWFAQTLLGDGSLSTNLERLGVLSILLVAGYVTHMEVEQQHLNLMEKLLAPRAEQTQTPLMARLLSLINSLPLIGKRLIDTQTKALATTIINLLLRDEQALVMYRSMMGSVIFIFLIFGLVRGEYSALPILLAGTSISMLVDGLRAMRHNPQANASWFFYTAPISAIVLFKSMRLAALMRSFLWPSLFVISALFMNNPSMTALLLTIGYLFIARFIATLLLYIQPVMPFSIDQKYTSSFFLSIGATLLFTLIGSGGYWLIQAFTNKFRLLGMAISLLLFVLIITIDLFLSRQAARRLAQQNYRF